MRLLLGNDLLDIARIKRAMENPRFCRRILGEAEYKQLEKRNFPSQSVAASFCAKEAFSKAIGTGVRGFSLHEVELLRRENGAPYLYFTGRAEEIVRALGVTFSVSVTHTADFASVVVAGICEAGPEEQGQ